MPRVFLGNFDFEHELAAGDAYRPTATVRRLNASLATAWLSLTDPEDAILVDRRPDAADLQAMGDLGFGSRFVSDPGELSTTDRWELTPWGWTDSAVDLAAKHRWRHRCPNLATIRLLNSRSYRWRLEREWDIRLPDSNEIHSLDDLQAAVARSPHAEWVLKANFGMAARERVRWRGAGIPEHVLPWVRRRLQDEPLLILEPWVERIDEAGIQIDIPESGTPVLMGVTPLLTDASGGYLGSRIDGSDENSSRWTCAIAVALRAAHRLQQEGYFGPLGIDAMHYRDGEGRERLRPLQDLNARYTMGRLALGWRRVLRDNECALWFHFPWDLQRWSSAAAWSDDMQSMLPAATRIVFTSLLPRRDDAQSRCSALLIAPSAEVLAKVTAVLTVSSMRHGATRVD